MVHLRSKCRKTARRTCWIQIAAGSAGKEISCSKPQSINHVNHLRYQKWMVPSWLEAGAVTPLCWGLSYVTCTCCCLQRDAKGEWRRFQRGEFSDSPGIIASTIIRPFKGNKSNSKRGSNRPNRYTIPRDPTGLTHQQTEAAGPAILQSLLSDEMLIFAWRNEGKPW